MPQSTQIADAQLDPSDCLAEVAEQRSDGLDLSIAPAFHLRMFVWSLGLSSILWYALIAAGHEVLKMWL